MDTDNWKLPPIEKIPEAYSAIADNRVSLDANSAKVRSSDNSKTYTVRWQDDAYTSDDNGSKWQNYSGYPILAVLLLQGKLPLNRRIADLFRAIPWKELNKAHKNKYPEALAEILAGMSESERNSIEQDMRIVYDALAKLQLKRLRHTAASRKTVPEVKLSPFPAPAVLETKTREQLAELLTLCRETDPVVFIADSTLENLWIRTGQGIHLAAEATFGKEHFQHFLSAFFSEDLRKVSHDVKPVMRRLLDRGLPAEGFVFDTALAAYLLNALEGNRPLGKIVPEYLSLEAPAGEAASTEAIALLQPKLTAELKRCGMQSLYSEIEFPLCRVLAEMEHTGVRVDPEMLKSFGKLLAQKMETVQKQAFEHAGEVFNLNSPKQLGELLFEKLKLPSGKKTKSGYSTDIEVLESLKNRHPVVADVMEFRQLSKLKSTYADGLLAEIAGDGRIHTTFQMMTTATGRLSSTEPNLQNIPVRSELGSELRKMFVAAPGHLLIDADYSQIELRILACISGDNAMQEAFRSGEDIHTATASQVFHVPPDQVTPDMRRKAKAVNFGIVYGISRFALAEDIGVSRKEADEYMNRYFQRYSGVRHYMDSIVEQAKHNGFVSTFLGRRRYLPELKSPVYAIRSFGERVALNAPIQGASADLIKLAMIHVFQRLKREKLRSRLILQIHDELLIESPLEEAAVVERLLKEEMEHVQPLAVPLTADVGAGPDWASAK